MDEREILVAGLQEINEILDFSKAFWRKTLNLLDECSVRHRFSSRHSTRDTPSITRNSVAAYTRYGIVAMG